jgi:hypothetical protein
VSPLCAMGSLNLRELHEGRVLKGHPSASDVIRHKVRPRQDAPTYLLCNEIHSEWIARYPDVNGGGSGTGNGRSSNAFTTVKIAVLAPSPKHRERIVTTVAIGLRANLRRP